MARIGRLFSSEECYFMHKCRLLLAHFAGEPFVSGWPEWATFAGIGVEAECYNERLKVALFFEPAKYLLPPAYHTMYDDAATMRKHIHDGFMISAARAGIAVIKIPVVIPDEELADYIRRLYSDFARERGSAFVGGLKF